MAPISGIMSLSSSSALRTMAKIRILLVGAIAIAGVATSIVIRHQAQVKLRENEAVSRQHYNQLTKLSTEHQRLSNLVVRATSSPADDQTAELAKLRNEAEMLRKQTNEFGKELAENHRSGPSQTAVNPEDYPEQYYAQRNQISAGKTADAHTLSVVLVNYALEHQGELPSNLDQVAPYLAKRHMSLTGTNDFEIVYQGSINELTNVPLRAVALVRERQAWLTPSGKWARVYAPVADGMAEVVESDDNFRSYEAEHIIPARAAGQ